MQRNLDRRIELLVPVLDRDCRRQAIKILEDCLKDNVKARRILPSGGYEKVLKPDRTAVRSQVEFQKAASQAQSDSSEAKRRRFIPQTPN